MKITSKKNHDYAGKLRRPKDSYEATPDHARFLVAHGFAEYFKEEKPQVKAAEKPVVKVMTVESVKGDEPKREYKRRDLTAEGSKD